MSKQFIPSALQQTIFDWALHGEGHAVVKAVPGSGKTTTLLQTIIRLLEANPNAKLIYAAFGKAIQLETQEKMREMGIPKDRAGCQTVNSIGNGVLLSFWRREHPGVDARFDEAGRKYRDLAKLHLMDLGLESASLASMIFKLVNICRVTLTEPTEHNILDLIDHYGLDIDPKDLAEFWDTVWRSVGPVMEAGRQMFLREGSFDFGDQVWLPNVLPNLTYPQYDFVLADECQDFNRAQTELVKRLVRRGRLLFCGDENQSIFGFNGADTESIPNIIEATNAKVLPLSICYRCPTDVVDLAAQIYPGIEAAPGAPKGIVQRVNDDDFITRVRPGDMVLCRTNAPLVSNCLRLLRAGIKAQVRGRDIGKQFKDLLYDFQKRIGFSVEAAPQLAEQYRREQVETLMRDPDKNASRIAAIHDKVDTFKVLIEAYVLKCLERRMDATVQGFCGKGGYIDGFFAVDEEKGEQLVLFSTGHKAKGLEKERVWVLEPGLLPHPAAKKAWELTQEENLLYVIVSRAKYSKTAPGELYFIGGKPAQLRLPGEKDGSQGVVLIAGAIQQIVSFPMPETAPVAALPAAAPAAIEAPAQRLVREAAAKLNHPAPAHGEALAELLPPGKTLLEAMDDPELQRQYQDNPVFAEILDAAFALEMQQTQETFAQRGVILSSDEELGKALGWPSPHQTPAPQGPQIIRVKVWGKWRDAEVLKVEKQTVSVRILAQDVSAGMSAFWTLGREAVKSEHQSLVWPTTTPAVAKVEKSAILAALEPSATALAAEMATTRSHYIEKTDICPDCGAACDLSGYACWSCGVVFSKREQMPAPVVVVEADPPAPVVDETLCVKCHERPRGLPVKAAPDSSLLCNWCREQFYHHAVAQAKEASRTINTRDPEFWRAAWPSFIGIAEPASVEAPAIVEVAPEPEAEQTALSAPAKGMCVSCGQRQALNIVANHPELAVLCGACRAQVLTQADQQAQATGWGHYERTVREVLAVFLGEHPILPAEVETSDKPAAQPREKKERTKDYHTALDGSKTRCQITLKRETIETLKRMGADPAATFEDLLYRWPPFLEALAQQKQPVA